MKFCFVILLVAAHSLAGQIYRPLTAQERAKWFAATTYGPVSLLVSGPIIAGLRTQSNSPEEWGPHWDGFGRRYGARVLTNTLNNGVEGSLGAIWNEDPRYFPRGQGSVRSRVGEAVKQTFLSRYGDGRYHFGAAKAVGVVAGAYGQDLWTPDSVNSRSNRAIRLGTNYGGRLIGNLFQEFNAELRKLWRRN